MAEKTDQQQVSTFLYCMGESAEDVLVSKNISEKDSKKYDLVIAQFDRFFKVRTNVIFESAKFNQRQQTAQRQQQTVRLVNRPCP